MIFCGLLNFLAFVGASQSQFGSWIKHIFKLSLPLYSVILEMLYQLCFSRLSINQNPYWAGCICVWGACVRDMTSLCALMRLAVYNFNTWKCTLFWRESRLLLLKCSVLQLSSTLFFLVLILDALADKQRQCMAEVVTPKAVLKSASCVCLVKLCAISIPDIWTQSWNHFRCNILGWAAAQFPNYSAKHQTTFDFLYWSLVVESFSYFCF